MDGIRTPRRRPRVAAACAGTFVIIGAIAWGAAGLTAAQQLKKLLAGLDPNKPVSLVMNGSEQALGATSAAGDLSLADDVARAVDPQKPYAVYKRDCSKYEIVVKGSDD